MSTGITSDDNVLLFELLSLLLRHRLSLGVFCEDLDYCWPTEDIWCGLMTKLFNGGETDITGYEKLLLFEWLSLQLEHRLSWGVVHCLTWLFPVPLLWQQPIPTGCGMMNAIWVFWWCCVPVILSVDGHQKVRSNFLARQLQSCLSFSTSNKIGCGIFVLISS